MNEKEEKTKKDNSRGCRVSIDNLKVKAKVVYVGGGRFRILKDEKNGKYVGKIVDASNIIHCRYPEQNNK